MSLYESLNENIKKPEGLTDEESLEIFQLVCEIMENHKGENYLNIFKAVVAEVEKIQNSYRVDANATAENWLNQVKPE